MHQALSVDDLLLIVSHKTCSLSCVGYLKVDQHCEKQTFVDFNTKFRLCNVFIAVVNAAN